MRRTDVGVGHFRRDRSLDASAFLRLLPGMGEKADGARKDEDSAAQRRWKPQLCKDHGARTVDIERYVFAFSLLQRRLDALAHLEKLTIDDLVGGRAIQQLHQPYSARVNRMETMAEAGHEFQPIDLGGNCRVEVRSLTRAPINRIQDRHALLTGAAMDVAKNIDARGNRTVEPNTACRGHRSDRARGRHRPAI